MPVDLNRGVSIRVHGATGIRVCMYKDEPGVYFDVNGAPITKLSMATEAGFDTERHERERKARMDTQAALAEIQRKYGLEQGGVLMEAAGYKAVSREDGMFDIINPDGDKTNPRPLSGDEAEKLILMLAQPDMGDQNEVPAPALASAHSTEPADPPVPEPDPDDDKFAPEPEDPDMDKHTHKGGKPPKK